MRILLIIASAVMLLNSCGNAKRAVSIETHDSTRVEVRTEHVEHIDTVYVKLPRQVERVETRDTSSRLENDYAVSEASIEGGLLHHSLETKPTPIPLPVKNTQERKDVSSYIANSERLKDIEFVEVAKPLTAWQRFKMRGFWALLAAMACWIAWKNKARILALLLRK